MMHTLRTMDRAASMVNLVSFHEVPMPRGLAFAINHVEGRGAKVDIFSADRTVSAIAEHNREFGTHLKAQQQLIDDFNAGRGNPANPIDETSHCYFADATIAALLTHYGHPTKVGDKIPWWALGIDLSDRGKTEDVSRFLIAAHNLGYDFRQPYSSGSERHHVIAVNSPIARLESWNVISKKRSST